MKTEELDNELHLLLDMEIKRYCFRVGRHGETYLLEKGIKDGLINSLVPKIKNFIEEKNNGV